MILGKTISTADGETVKVSNNWTAQTEKRGTTVSSSAWECTAGTLTSQTLSGATTTVLLSDAGYGWLTNTVVLANGETLVNKRRISTCGSAD